MNYLLFTEEKFGTMYSIYVQPQMLLKISETDAYQKMLQKTKGSYYMKDPFLRHHQDI